MAGEWNQSLSNLGDFIAQLIMRNKQMSAQGEALKNIGQYFQTEQANYSQSQMGKPSVDQYGVPRLTQPISPQSVSFQTVPTTPSPTSFDFLSALANYSQMGGNANPFMQAAVEGQGQFHQIPPGETYGVLKGPNFTQTGQAAFKPPTPDEILLRSEPITINGITKQKDTYGYKTNKGEVVTRQTYSDFTPPISGSGINAGAWVQTKDAMGRPTGFVNKITGEAKSLSESAKELVGAPLSGTTKTMIETAPKVSDLIKRMRPQVKEVANQLGPIPGRWNQFMTGQVGSSDPKFNALRVNAGLLGTLLMRMHVGARGSEKIMEKFDQLIGLGKQSPENFNAALDEIQAYANSVESEKAGITPEMSGPKVGDVEGGYKFKGGDPSDPKNWEKQ